MRRKKDFFISESFLEENVQEEFFLYGRGVCTDQLHQTKILAENDEQKNVPHPSLDQGGSGVRVVCYTWEKIKGGDLSRMS